MVLVYHRNFTDMDRFEVLLDQSQAAEVLAAKVLTSSHLGTVRTSALSSTTTRNLVHNVKIPLLF